MNVSGIMNTPRINHLLTIRESLSTLISKLTENFYYKKDILRDIEEYFCYELEDFKVRLARVSGKINFCALPQIRLSSILKVRKVVNLILET